MIRVKRQTTGTYTFTETAVNDDGDLLTPDGPYTAELYDGSGALIATRTPTCVNGVFSRDFDHDLLPYLDTYQVVWTGHINGVDTKWTTDIELVGGYIFEIADLRGKDRVFKDTTKYPTWWLREVRTAVEDTLEGPRAAQLAFVPRGKRETVDGTSPDLTRGYNPLLYGADYRGLKLPDFEVRDLYSLSINGTALTQDELDAITIDDNMLWKSAGVQWPAWSWGHRNISVHYEYGLDRPSPAVTRAALMLATEYLVTSPIPGRATATSIGDQMFRLTIAGRDGVTGLPEVDAAIDQYGRKGFGIG